MAQGDTNHVFAGSWKPSSLGLLNIYWVTGPFEHLKVFRGSIPKEKVLSFRGTLQKGSSCPPKYVVKKVYKS